MKSSSLNSFKLCVVFFCLGILALIVGVNGESIAIFFSRPSGAASWGTSESMMNGFTYIPMFIGAFFFILASIVFTISYIKVQKN
ncbi:hypothetical protein PO902_17705 (plasmid) [Planococcus maritimus]|uniref:hypothetical protein n=1 Tax=Planococcus rifietoensis TaxID=200991 RepID=UPI00237FB3C7|nr:hypothetical protein [Planococcus sp. SK3692]MDE4086886.1 hypothetical protein [Planococcus maritimus]